MTYKSRRSHSINNIKSRALFLLRPCITMHLLSKHRLDIKVLEAYFAAKKVKRQQHPTEPLSIWNYSESTQFKRWWDHVTLQCRALVTDTEGNVVARSFPKFFNENEVPYKPTKTWKVYEKLDGSLGLLFSFRGKWIFSSRGSFTSEQARMGWKILSDKHAGIFSHLDVDVAYTFEIIYPANRIVVDYGQEEKLVFLAAFDRTEVEHTEGARGVMENAGVPVVRELNLPAGTTLSDLLHHDRANEEGYVVRFTDGKRVKIKFPRYIALHKVMSNVTLDFVLQCYKDRVKALTETTGAADTPALEDTPAVGVPDELQAWVKQVWDRITTHHERLRREFDVDYHNTHAAALKESGQSSKGLYNRAAFARAVESSPLKSALFARLDGKPHQTLLVNCIRVSDIEK